MKRSLMVIGIIERAVLLPLGTDSPLSAFSSQEQMRMGQRRRRGRGGERAVGQDPTCCPGRSSKDFHRVRIAVCISTVCPPTLRVPSYGLQASCLPCTGLRCIHDLSLQDCSSWDSGCESQVHSEAQVSPPGHSRPQVPACKMRHLSPAE